MNHLAATLRAEVKVCPMRVDSSLPLLDVCRLKVNMCPASFIHVNEKLKQEVYLTGFLMRVVAT